MLRRIKLLLLLLLLALAACWQTEKQTAEQRAREYMTGTIGAKAVDRAHVEVRAYTGGWQVIFRDANASCDEGVFWPGACSYGSRTFRDVYACVERDGLIRQVGASPATASIGDDEVCQVLPPLQTAPEPTIARNPSPLAAPRP